MKFKNPFNKKSLVSLSLCYKPSVILSGKSRSQNMDKNQLNIIDMHFNILLKKFFKHIHIFFMLVKWIQVVYKTFELTSYKHDSKLSLKNILSADVVNENVVNGQDVYVHKFCFALLIVLFRHMLLTTNY